MDPKFIFVTGGVVSSLGKGITAASLGRLLKARGLKVALQKFDPYLNVDPGTMSPYQHGEVFVTDDGAETCLLYTSLLPVRGCRGHAPEPGGGRERRRLRRCDHAAHPGRLFLRRHSLRYLL